MTLNHEIHTAIQHISNESIVQEEGQEIVDIVLDDLEDIPETAKKVIEEEFKNILDLLEWQTHAKDIFSRWYTDGRLYYHAIIDEKATQEGIQELRYIDPRKIRKVREIIPKKDPEIAKVPGSEMISTVKNEYYVFNARGFSPIANNSTTYQYAAPTTGLRIAKDAIVHITSGITNETGSLVISYLHKAIKPLNQLRALEDAAIIYRLARAPERRVFYIDTGNMPHIKAEQYVQSMITKYKNRLVYDAVTGEIRDDRKMMTMMEDFWLPRREGGKGTEIDILQGANMNNVIDEVDFFKQRLYDALDVPYARTHPDAMFQGGAAVEISRDEINFGMFIDTLRLRFNTLFLAILEKQLILKQIILPDDWTKIQHKIKFTYARNNLFAELKEREVMNGRMMTLQLIAPYVGRFYSNKWIRKNILKQTDEDIEEMDQDIMEELQNPLYQAPLGMPEGQGMDQMGQDSQQPGMDQTGLSVQPPMPGNPKSINKSKKPGKDKSKDKAA